MRVAPALPSRETSDPITCGCTQCVIWLGIEFNLSLGRPVILSLMATVFPFTSFCSPPSWSNMVESTSPTCRSYSGQTPMATRLAGAFRADAIAGRAMYAPAAIPIAPRNCLREQFGFIVRVTSLN